jgi:hypothetical protein
MGGKMLLQAMAQSPAAPPVPIWVAVVVKLLEWPFLFFLALAVFLAMFRVSLGALLARGDITLSWGDGKIRLLDLSTNLDKDLDPIREDIEAIKQSLALRGSPQIEGSNPPDQAIQPRTAAATERILHALITGKYNWRSIERLAAIAGVSEEDAREILSANPNVEFSMGKSGRPIAGLRSRVRG